MKNVLSVALLALLLVALSCVDGCSKEQPSASIFSSPTTWESPLPAPPIESPLALPSPTSGVSVIGGVVVDVQTQRAPLEGIVYLAKVVSLDTGQPVVRLDRHGAPSAVPTEKGEFIFPEVEPGDYGVVLWTPDVSFLLENPRDGKSLILTVGPDEILDLGRIEVPMP